MINADNESRRKNKKDYTNKSIAPNQNPFVSRELPIPYSDIKIREHLRALSRIHMAEQLTKEIAEEIIRLRADYGISFKWKEDIRKSFEKEIQDTRSLRKLFYKKGYYENTNNPILDKINLYTGIRGKIRGDDDPIDIRDILLLHNIVIDCYRHYQIGTGGNYNQVNKNILSNLFKAKFNKDLHKLAEKSGIKSIYHLIFNTEPMFYKYKDLYQTYNLMEYYDTYINGKKVPERYEMFKPFREPSNGIYLPFESLRGLDRVRFIYICGLIYDERRELFKEWKGISAAEIIFNINAYLIRDLEGVKSNDIARITGSSPSEAFDTKINNGISRLRNVANIPIIKTRRKKQ